MNILVLGNGAREHALVWKFSQSKYHPSVFVIPGNDGMKTLAANEKLSLSDFDSLLAFAKKQHIDFIIVGPEQPLCDGIVDFFKKNNVSIIGPSKEAANLEGSKIYTKNLAKKLNIPSAHFIECDSYQTALSYFENSTYPQVIKADGLAAGKGVTIEPSYNTAKETLQNLFLKNTLGKSGQRIVIEEFLEGEEVSLIGVTDGKSIFPLCLSQDHKQLYDNDLGPNTGGMGAYCPVTHVFDRWNVDLHTLSQQFLEPVIQYFYSQKVSYKGFLYAGIMLTKKGPKLLEYNVRLGDPEAQSLMMLLKSDLADICKAVLEQTLTAQHIQFHRGSSACVVITSDGYPQSPKTGFAIKGLSSIQTNDTLQIFHAGTLFKENTYYNNGGRVLSVTSRSESLDEALSQIYNNITKITFEGMYYRKDIGFRRNS